MEEVAASMTIAPDGVAQRQTARWRGVAAEIVQVTRNEPYEYGFKGPFHLLTACDRAIRVDGETRVEGLPTSSRHDLSRKLCFVPANHEFHGWFVPRLLPRSTYIFLDPARLPVDPELGFAELDFPPRLFFDDGAIWSTVEKLQALVERPDSGSRLYAECLTAVLAVELARMRGGAAPAQPRLRGGLAAWQQRLVADYIEEHLTDEISLSELAGLARLSPTHFCRAFKRSFGVAPHRYQIERRIGRAKQLLADRTRSVTEIALTSGFGCSSNFATAFRKATGCTPTDFRRSMV